MKKTITVLAVCGILVVLFLSACSSPEQSQSPSSNNLETTEEGPAKNRNIMQYNEIVRWPLAGSEPEEIREQSRLLQDAEIEGMTAETADLLAEYFIRCQRIDIEEPKSSIVNARHEMVEYQHKSGYRSDWEYWILTASSGTEYWLMGFTDDSFYVSFIFRDSPEGEILYGYYM